MSEKKNFSLLREGEPNVWVFRLLICVLLAGLCGTLYATYLTWPKAIRGEDPDTIEELAAEIRGQEAALKVVNDKFDLLFSQVQEGKTEVLGELDEAKQKQSLLQSDLELARGNLEAMQQRGPKELDVLLMVFLLGALGGFLRAGASLVKYVGNGKLSQRWFLYYYVLPIAGALTAPIIYLLFRSGMLASNQSGSSGTEHLNLISIYGFAALTGLYSKNATDKLEEVFNTFLVVKDKDGDHLGNGESTPGGEGVADEGGKNPEGKGKS